MGSQGALAFVDDDGEEVVLDSEEAGSLLTLTAGLDAATVSACPGCRSRVLACVALVDLLEDAPPHPRAREIMELADDAPTLHLYVQDLATECAHVSWRDPGSAEWAEALEDVLDDPPALR
ncbi:MAG: hypothetical protein WD598_03135 [Acidimicrobiia bacterium]